MSENKKHLYKKQKYIKILKFQKKLLQHCNSKTNIEPKYITFVISGRYGKYDIISGK